MSSWRNWWKPKKNEPITAPKINSMEAKKTTKYLTEQDYINAAKFLECEVACVKAVKEIESAGSGYNSDGSVKILFEGHIFWRLTGGKYGNNMFSYPRWIRTYYNMNQHKRLQAAVEKDRNAALQSASWGLFQIMGMNYKLCGFSSVQEFVNAMIESEGAQLMAFCHFVKNSKIDDELREKDWAGFALRYNGKGYKANKYDTKLAAAYKKYSK